MNTKNNSNKIEVTSSLEPSRDVQALGQGLFEMALAITGDPNAAIEGLLLAAADLVVHNDGNLALNVESVKAQFEQTLQFCLTKHASCIEGLRADGIQHDRTDHMH